MFCHKFFNWFIWKVNENTQFLLFVQIFFMFGLCSRPSLLYCRYTAAYSVFYAFTLLCSNVYEAIVNVYFTQCHAVLHCIVLYCSRFRITRSDTKIFWLRLRVSVYVCYVKFSLFFFSFHTSWYCVSAQFVHKQTNACEFVLIFFLFKCKMWAFFVYCFALNFVCRSNSTCVCIYMRINGNIDLIVQKF